jgi:putative DNA primase/helicase
MAQEIPAPSAGARRAWKIGNTRGKQKPTPEDAADLAGYDALVAAIEAPSRAIAKSFGADSCFNIDRVTRLPGTVNVPSEKKIREKGQRRSLAHVVWADWDRLYSHSDFPTAPAGEPRRQAPGAATAMPPERREPADWCLKVISDPLCNPDGKHHYHGHRSRAAAAICCELIRCGRTDDELRAVLTDEGNGISDHVRKQKPMDRYIVKTIAWAHKQVDSELILSPGAPLDSARECVRRRHMEEGQATIRAELYDFLDGAKQQLDDGTIAPFNPTKFKVSNVLDALAAYVNISASVRAPRWLDDDGKWPADEIIACKNGLLHLPTATLLEHTPNFYTHNALDFDYDANAPEPVEWLKFLGTLWDGKTEENASDDAKAAAKKNANQTIETLQETFGYLLTADTSQQKAFMQIGPKRCGKGTIARMATRLVGAENVAGPTLASLCQNFGLQPLIGKRVAIISDARLGSHADQQAITERLLAISGEDMLTIDRKNRTAWTGHLDVRFMVLSNELPRLTDASGALVSRFILFVMTKSFYGKEDLGLGARLGTELPGILNWSIKGWRRLKERGYFVQPVAATETLRQFEDLSSPIGAFLRDRCIIDAGQSVPVDNLFKAWTAWCSQQGRDYPGSKQSFGRDLSAAEPGLKVSQPRDGDSRLRVYQGIGLQPTVKPNGGGDAPQDDLCHDDARAAAENGPPEDLDRRCPPGR